jgi:general stress protein YciG
MPTGQQRVRRRWYGVRAALWGVVRRRWYGVRAALWGVGSNPGGMASIAGSYGRSVPSGMTRLLVNGTNPPMPSGTDEKRNFSKDYELASAAGHKGGHEVFPMKSEAFHKTTSSPLRSAAKAVTRRAAISRDQSRPSRRRSC